MAILPTLNLPKLNAVWINEKFPYLKKYFVKTAYVDFTYFWIKMPTIFTMGIKLLTLHGCQHTVWKITIKRDHKFYGKIDTFPVKLTFLLKHLLNS